MIKSRETPKQGITVVRSTTNQTIHSQRSSITCEIASEMLRIPDLSKTRLIVMDLCFGHASKRKKKYYQTKVQGCLNRREEITKTINWERGFHVASLNQK